MIITTTILDQSYTMKPAPEKITQEASGAVAVDAAWTIHVNDGFDTQIGNRLERRGRRFRFVLGDGRFIETETEHEIGLFIRGVLTGRCLC
jgi:hypothetical protein